MEKIPFAEDLIDKLTRSNEYPSNFISETEIEEAIIEFTKIHVKAALLQASEQITDGYVHFQYGDKILNSYPLDLIK